MKNSILILTPLIACTGFIGCASKPLSQDLNTSKNESTMNTSLPLSINSLTQHAWQLDSVTDADGNVLSYFDSVKNKTQLRLNYTKSSASASFTVGCNSMGGMVMLTGSQFSVSRIISTRMMCSGDTGKAERTLSDIMSSNNTLSLSSHDNQHKLTQISETGVTLHWFAVKS